MNLIALKWQCGGFRVDARRMQMQMHLRPPGTGGDACSSRITYWRVAIGWPVTSGAGFYLVGHARQDGMSAELPF